MEELERAVVQTWSRDTLEVYADALQGAGDVRGEIIALELAGLDTTSLLKKWLGFDARSWRGVRFRYGFVECTAIELERVLATPAAPYLRAVAIGGTSTDIQTALRMLAGAPRRWLARLHVQGRSREPSSPVIVGAELAAAIVDTLPNLDFLDVTGTRVFAELAHPTLRRVRVIGHDALASIAEAGPALPGVEELFYAFGHDDEGRIVFSPRGLPPTLLAAHTLPALVSLDLSANDMQRSWERGRVVLDELLPELGVLPQLRTLRLPAIENEAERALVQHALDLAPRLAALHLTRDPAALAGTLRTTATIVVSDPPAPSQDRFDGGSTYEVRIENHPQLYQVSLRRLGELVARSWHTLDDDARDDWHLVWKLFVQLPPIDWDIWTDRPFDAVRSVLLRRALATLDDDVDDDPIWSALAAELRPRDVMLFLRRFRAY